MNLLGVLDFLPWGQDWGGDPCRLGRRLTWPSTTQLNKAFQAEESPGVIYCISMQWFREWEAFVKGKDNGEWALTPCGVLLPEGTSLPEVVALTRGLMPDLGLPGRSSVPSAGAKLVLLHLGLVIPPSYKTLSLGVPLSSLIDGFLDPQERL